MEKHLFYLLILLATLRCGADATTPTAMDFIRASCKTTLHPTLCVRCLSTYAASIQGSDHHLTKAVILVSLSNAKSAAAFVSKLAGASGLKPRESQALKDYMNSMANSVAGLSQSVQEPGRMGGYKGANFEWHMSNVETL